MTEPSAFRRQVRANHKAAFRQWFKVAQALEDAVAAPRNLRSPLRLALDFFLVQSYKSHGSVGLLAERAQTEDAATLTRRLLEMGVQAAYIARPRSRTEADRRAGTFLAHLWRSAPDELRRTLPVADAEAFEEIWTRHRGYLPKLPYRWGPELRGMFRALGIEETYVQDYSLLSALSHGTDSGILHDYTRHPIPIHSDRHVSIILRYASRYYLGTAIVWNRVLRVVRMDTIKRLLSEFAQDAA